MAKKKTQNKGTTAQDRLEAVVGQLNERFPERAPVVNGLMVGAISRKHCCLFGPPGTAKSLIVRTWAEAVYGNNGAFWQWLFTKFTTPSEVFGPISFQALKQDRYEHNTTGKAPEARVWFCDEIFKANSSILNALLTAINERLFFNGANVVKLPLETVVGASNEYPQDESLEALYDRFLLRFWVPYIGNRDALSDLILAGGVAPMTASLETGDIAELREAAENVPFGKSQVGTLLDVKAAIEDEGFAVSDRAWVQAPGLIRANAIVRGRDKVIASDYMILADSLWKEATDRAKLAKTIGNAADPYGSRAEAIIDAVKTAVRELPDLSLLKNNQKTKGAMTTLVAEVSAKLNGLDDKMKALESEAGAAASDTIAEARGTLEEALTGADERALEIVRFRG